MAKETLLRAGSLRSRSVRMRHLLILAAAAFLAVGCARNQDETGAAPDQGDTTVTETDTSFVQQDTTAADATMSTDSVGAQGEVQTGDTTSMTADTTSTTGAWTD